MPTQKEHPQLYNGQMVPRLLDETKTQTRRVLKPQPNDADCLRIIGPDNKVHYTRPMGHADIEEALRTKGYSVKTCHQWLEETCKIKVGDLIWVREEHYRFGQWEKVEGVKTKGGKQKWKFVPDSAGVVFVAPECEYRKGRHSKDPETKCWHKRIARFMPKAFSRITLEVTAVRVERLQDISEEDAIAEGIERVPQLGILRASGWQNYQFETAHTKRGVEVTDHQHRTVGYMSPIKSYASLWNSINGPAAWDQNPFVVATSFKRIK